MDPILYRAAMEGSVDLLLQKSDKFGDQMTPNNNTVLHIAALFGQTECVNEILTTSPSLLLRVNADYETPLHLAVTEQHVETVHALIERARAISEELESEVAALNKEMMRMTNEDGDIALHGAVRNGNLRVVKMLIEEDPEFSHPSNKAKETPLYLAAENKLEDCVSEILNICTSPSFSGPCGRTALHAAAIFNCGGSMTKLLNWKPDLANEVDQKGWTPLHHAAYYGHLDRVRQLLDFNVSLAYSFAKEEEKEDKYTNNIALHIAASRGHTNVMECLISNCPDCWEMVNSKGQNIVHIALENHQDEVIKFILKLPNHLQGRLISQKDFNGNTPLHSLAASVSKCFVPELITHPRAYHMAFNNESMTPLDVYTRQPPEDFPGVVGRTILKFGAFGRRFMNNEDDILVPSTQNFQTEPEPQRRSGVEKLEKPAETYLIVATLIATVTFAAGFTLPGGYDGTDGANQGRAVLARKAVFKLFVITDTIAMVCSSTAIFINFLLAGLKNKTTLLKHQGFANILVMIAEVAMMLSFISGIYVVLPHSLGLAISVCVLGFFFILIQFLELIAVFRHESI